MDGFPNMGTTEAPPYVPLQAVRMSALQGTFPPSRVWIVEDWLPCGEVTSNYGDGGTGKTLLAQQLGTGCAAGLPWIGLPVLRCRVFALFCEDSKAEIQRRQEAINAHLGIDYDQLDDFAFASGKGEDNELIQFEGSGGDFHLTERFDDLVAQAVAHRAKLVIIDTAADTFGGNENDRRQVRRYVGTALARLARDIDGAVLVNAHPSRSGLKGDQDSGSTGWSNSVRSRWSIERPEGEEGTRPDPDARILTRRKANYARIGDTIPLVWRNGLLVPTSIANPADPYVRINMQMMAETRFMELLAKCAADNIMLSDSKNAGNFAPKKMAARPEAGGIKTGDFTAAMNRLYAAGRITNVAYGRKSDERFRIAAVETNDAEETNDDADDGVQEWREACAEAGFPQPEMSENA